MTFDIGWKLRKANVEACTANEGPVRIQYKCLVPIYVFPEMKLCGLLIFQNRIVIFCLPISTFMYQIHECRNWERGCSVSFLGRHKSDFGTGLVRCIFVAAKKHAKRNQQKNLWSSSKY